jgi:hypothetical protein
MAIRHGNRIAWGSTDPGWRVARAQQSLRPAAQEPRMLRPVRGSCVSWRSRSCRRPLCGLARPSSANAQCCSALALRRGKRPIDGRGSPPNPTVMATELASLRRARTSPLSLARIARQPVRGSVPGVPRCYCRPPCVTRCQQAEFVPGLGPWSGYCHGAKIPGVRHKLRSGEIRAGIMPMVHAVFHACVAGKSCEMSHVARGGLAGPAWA